MTTTVRSVRVELEAAIAGYIRDMKLAGAETDRAFSGIEARIGGANRSIGQLDKSTGGLARTSAEARVQQTQLSNGIDRVGSSSRRSEASIDKYSGRLKTILGLVQLLGPAALRLGAGALPVLSAGFAGLGAAGGAIGVTLLALHGVKDAMKALNDYELERTPENLRKVQQAFAEIGPEGAHFVQVLRDLQPEIDQLQQLSRAGVLPGFESFIDSMTTRLPIVSQIVNRLSREVGRLSADAGDALAGDEWTPFFEYVRSSAAPILDDFARSAGNVALGLANILVAFDPLTRDFTSGLEDMTGRFADWSQHLEDDEGFQSFLDTVREAGPELKEFLGATIDLFAGLVRASAPLAATTLPILTGIVKIFAAIANSPIGPTLYTAAAAWTLYSRAAKLAEASTGRIQTQWAGMSKAGKAGAAAAGIGLIATALTDYDEKLGLSNTATLGFAGAMAGPWGAAAGATVGLLVDITQANDDLAAATQRAQDALNSGDTSQMRDQLEQLRDEIQETEESASLSPGSLRHLGFGGTIDKLGGLWSKYSGEEDEAKAAAEDLDSALRSNRGTLDLIVPLLGDAGDELADAAQAAQQLSNALAVLNGWFDKRDAIRGYKDAIHEIAQGLKDGFSRDDVSNIDAAGRSILQVANLIQNPKRRADFLADAREQLEDLAANSGPRAAAAIQKVIDKFDSEGLTNPPPIKLTADDKAAEAAFVRSRRSMADLNSITANPTITADDRRARNSIRAVSGFLFTLSKETADPKVTVDPGNSLSILARIAGMLGNLHDKDVTVTTTYNHRGGPTSDAQSADGSTVPKSGLGYRDRYPYLLADGEEVISNRHGQADRHRALLKKINAGHAADGSTTGNTYTHRRSSGDTATDNNTAAPLHETAKAADRVAGSLKRLENRLEKVQKSYDKEKAKLDDLISSRSSLASSIASAAVHDPFGNGVAGLDAQVEADTNDIDAMTAALAKLVENGLSPKSALYQALAASMDVNTAQQLAALSAGELASRAQRFQALGDKAQGLGDTIAGQRFDEAVRESTKETKELRQELHRLRDAIHDLPKNVKDGAKEGSRDGSEEGSRKGSNEGTRAGVRDRDVATAAKVRTGGRR